MSSFIEITWKVKLKLPRNPILQGFKWEKHLLNGSFGRAVVCEQSFYAIGLEECEKSFRFEGTFLFFCLPSVHLHIVSFKAPS